MAASFAFLPPQGVGVGEGEWDGASGGTAGGGQVGLAKPVIRGRPEEKTPKIVQEEEYEEDAKDCSIITVSRNLCQSTVPW